MRFVTLCAAAGILALGACDNDRARQDAAQNTATEALEADNPAVTNDITSSSPGAAPVASAAGDAGTSIGTNAAPGAGLTGSAGTQGVDSADLGAMTGAAGGTAVDRPRGPSAETLANAKEDAEATNLHPRTP